MATRNPLLPTKEQCLALTPAQCRMIQDYLDPQGQRAHRNWEQEHQVSLIRQYMTMRSFPAIEEAMKPRLEWSYKTYSNRFRDWLFPVDRIEREQTIVDLFALVSGAGITNSFPASPHTPSTLPNRQLQPHPSTPQSGSQSPMAVPSDFFSNTPLVNLDRNPTLDRMSIATNNTWTSGSASTISTYYDDTFSNHRLSVDTTSSSISGMSQISIPRSHPEPQRRPLEPPKHDPNAGLWNRSLHVIPCGEDHSQLLWHEMVSDCSVCGFSQCHALMIHAREMDVRTFLASMRKLADVERVDFAGNHPIHFLMSAGVGMDYYSQLLQWTERSGQNSFGQNPLHVLNPQDLGDQLITLLEWFKKSHNPPGLLHTQRDINCRTPLHAILQYPLERSLYQKMLKCFLYAEHQLRSFDASGRTAIKMMNKASLKIKSESYSDYGKIQVGITETKLFLSAAENSPTTNHHLYGFHDIARGARGTSYMGSTFFQCRICNLTNAHSNSYRDQMKCACKAGRDRNGPDETGMTPAHALVTQTRCNNNPEPKPETAGETAELFRILIPHDDPTLREALHVLDPEGNSLIYNIATRGLDEILEYALALEDPARRKAMVNTYGKEPNGTHWSVLRAVMAKRAEMYADINMADSRRDHYGYQILCEKVNRLTRCKNILLAAGAELEPTLTTTWRIVYPPTASSPLDHMDFM